MSGSFVNRRIAEVGYICCVIHIADCVIHIADCWYHLYTAACCWYPFQSVSDTAVRWCCALVLEDCSQLFIFSQYCLLAHSALVDHSRRLFTAIWYLWFVIFITKRICFCYYNKTVCWMIMKSCLISSLVKVKNGAHSS